MIKIGDFANMFDVSIKTIRFYEEKKLLKPAYVDVYTGYRYFDEENIKQMSTILAYKSLGFELSEIKDIHNETIINKIKEYERNIKTMHYQINALETLLQDKEGEVNMKTFINDENVIGKWKLLGISNTKEDFEKGILLDDNILVKELYLMEKGEEYWVISWTKGYIYINNKPYAYEVSDNKMYVTLTGLYSDDEKVAVYEKVDNKHYTVDEIMKKDNTNVPFAEDGKVVGLWNSIGIIDNKDEFDLSNIEKGIIKNLSLFPNGEANITFNSGNSRSISYTKGFIKDFGMKDTMGAYEIKKIDNRDYLIIEWKSGDYVFGGVVVCYYVFERATK